MQSLGRRISDAEIAELKRRNDIKGEWGAGDYCGERTYRLKCKNPLNRGTPIVSVKA